MDLYPMDQLIFPLPLRCIGTNGGLGPPESFCFFGNIFIETFSLSSIQWLALLCTGTEHTMLVPLIGQFRHLHDGEHFHTWRSFCIIIQILKRPFQELSNLSSTGLLGWQYQKYPDFPSASMSAFHLLSLYLTRSLRKSPALTGSLCVLLTENWGAFKVGTATMQSSSFRGHLERYKFQMKASSFDSPSPSFWQSEAFFFQPHSKGNNFLLFQ